MRARGYRRCPAIGQRCRALRGPLKFRPTVTESARLAVDLARQPPTPLPPDPLTELLAATARGDRQAFAELYRLTRGRLYAITLALLRQREAAEDVLQETYLAVWRAAGQYQPGRASALVWLMAITRHRAIEWLRRRRRRAAENHAEPLSEEALQIPDSQPSLSVDHPAHAVQECLRRLSAEQSQAIKLAFFQGLSHEELAARLQAPLGTVKSWIRRGLLQLKGCLES
ncbi:MAG TPA: sigma-70 family RNA polymerase sigma factor [Candidatus Competibacter sp.]|nr:sigma-70 family RNA polymerase sigma factor [Candidatus Competibacter sp.]